MRNWVVSLQCLCCCSPKLVISFGFRRFEDVELGNVWWPHVFMCLLTIKKNIEIL